MVLPYIAQIAPDELPNLPYIRQIGVLGSVYNELGEISPVIDVCIHLPKSAPVTP